MDAEAGETLIDCSVTVFTASWVMVSVMPGAIVMVPCRCGPVLAATVNPRLLLPEPAPNAGEVTVIQLALLVPFHGHELWFCPGLAVTPREPVPPLLPKFSLLNA